MDISFQTTAGGDTWSLTTCAEWAKANDFDCIRLADSGVLNSDDILELGPDKVNTILSKHQLYLAAVTSHCNLLDDDQQVAQAQQTRLIKALKAAGLLE